MHFNQNNNFEQTQFWTVGVASLRFYLDLWRGMLCKIKNDFYSLVGVHYEYLRTHKLGNCVFYIKQHVWADTVLKSLCVEFLNSLTLRETLVVCKIKNGFYRVIYFHCEYLRLKNSKMLVFKENNAFEQTQFWPMGVVYFGICLL